MRAPPFFGIVGGVAMASIAVAPPQETHDGKKSIGTIDYHEIAHNVVPSLSTNMVYAGTYPPTLLVEGWAQSRSENWETLASDCWGLKQPNQALTLREAVSDVYYNQIDHRLYQQGGALLKILCDKFGPEKFLELYLNCTRKTFPQDVERIYGMTLEQLDALYWQEIESYRASLFEQATEKCSPEEKELLDEFRQAYQRQMQEFYRLTDNGTLEAVVYLSEHRSDGDADAQEELLFQARAGQLARCDKKYVGTVTKISPETGEKTEQKFEQIDCDLITPSERLSTFQHSLPQHSSPQQNTRRFVISPHEREYQLQCFKRHNLMMFQPLVLFETRGHHWFSNPDDYLWTPPTGTNIQSVALEGDTAVLTLTTPEYMGYTLTLRLDRSRDWLLLDAKWQSKTFEALDIREYGEDAPFPKKHSVSKEGETFRITEETELIRFDPAPVDEDVFREDNLPLSVPPRSAEMNRLPVEQRIRLHLAIAGVWLIVPLLVIFISRSRQSPPPGTAGFFGARASRPHADETSANPGAGETPALHKIALL